MVFFDGSAWVHLFLLVVEYLAPPGRRYSSNTEEGKLYEIIQRSMRGVKVNREDAVFIETELSKFTVWKEHGDWDHTKKIKIEDMPRFLDHLFEAYKDNGLSIQDRKKWNGIFFGKEWVSKILEWKFTGHTDGIQGARYAIVALVKSSDGKFVDCMLATYKLDFVLTPNEMLSVNSIFSKIYKWSNNDDKGIVMAEIERFKNFFRYKALMEFKKQGIIEKISFANEF